MERKKGIQLNQAFGAVLTLVLVAVLVIIAIVIFVNLDFEGTTSVSISAETVTIPTGTGQALAGNANCSAANFAVSNMSNSTIGPAILAANYTVSATGIVTNLTSEFITDNWIAYYTYTHGGPACEASVATVGEFDNYTSLIGLVGTIIFLGLVIGILVASFAFGGKREM